MIGSAGAEDPIRPDKPAGFRAAAEAPARASVIPNPALIDQSVRSNQVNDRLPGVINPRDSLNYTPNPPPERPRDTDQEGRERRRVFSLMKMTNTEREGKSTTRGPEKRKLICY